MNIDGIESAVLERWIERRIGVGVAPDTVNADLVSFAISIPSKFMRLTASGFFSAAEPRIKRMAFALYADILRGAKANAFKNTNFDKDGNIFLTLFAIVVCLF